MASQVPEADVHKYEKLFNDSKAKLTAIRGWKGRAEPDKALFDRELQHALSYSKAAFGIFRDDQQFHRLAEELAETVVETRNHLGPDLMPLERHHVFSRGIFEVNQQTIIAGQYYEELPFYGPPKLPGPSGGPHISKFYEWKIIDSPRDKIQGDSIQVKCIYYLEKGELFSVYYVLGYSAPGMHATVKLYQQNEKPSFFEVCNE
jgi:hypothetical protein